jgi:Tfp pilus assembly protein PilF
MIGSPPRRRPQLLRALDAMVASTTAGARPARLQQGNKVGARASFRAAIALDPNDWQSWLDLAASVHGACAHSCRRPHPSALPAQPRDRRVPEADSAWSPDVTAP